MAAGNRAHGRSLRFRLRVAFGVVVLASVLVVVVSLATQRESRESELELARRWRPASGLVARVAVSVVDQETGVRGYVITADEEFLEPYEAGRPATAAAIEDLRRVLRDRPALLQRIDDVEAAIDAWYLQAAEPEIALVRAGDVEGARSLVDARTGKVLFDAIRERVEELSTEIEAERTGANEDVTRAIDRSTLVVVLGLSGVALLAVALWAAITRWITQPLLRVSAEVEQVAGGDLGRAVPAMGPREIAAVAAGVDRMRLRLLDELEGAARLRALEAERSERRRIAAELHDDPVQAIYAAQLRMDVLRQDLGPEQAAQAAQAARIADDLRAVQVRLRSLMFRLHPPSLEEEGLRVSLEDLLAEVFASATAPGATGPADDVVTSVQVADDVGVGPAVEALLYRVAAEAVRNAAKHAHPSRVTVEVRADATGCWLQVTDDGAGFSVADRPDQRSGHHGLAIVGDLVEAAAGTLHVDSTPGRGTQVRVWLPYRPVGRVRPRDGAGGRDPGREPRD